MIKKSNLADPIIIPVISVGFISFLFLSLSFTEIIGYIYLIVPIILIFLLSFIELYRKAKSPVLNISASLLSVFYLSVPFALGSLIFTIDTSFKGIFLLGFFAIVWTNDTMAYVTGMLFGKHRLFERISPKKSWEGFIGGLLFSAAVGFAFGYYTGEKSPWFWIGYAVLISLTSTVGDLVESMFKRSAGIKDSGKILPGHGGVLDRFDGALMAFPFAAAYLVFFF